MFLLSNLNRLRSYHSERRGRSHSNCNAALNLKADGLYPGSLRLLPSCDADLTINFVAVRKARQLCKFLHTQSTRNESSYFRPEIKLSVCVRGTLIIPRPSQFHPGADPIRSLPRAGSLCAMRD